MSVLGSDWKVDLAEIVPSHAPHSFAATHSQIDESSCDLGRFIAGHLLVDGWPTRSSGTGHTAAGPLAITSVAMCASSIAALADSSAARTKSVRPDAPGGLVVDGGHVVFVVAFAGGRREVIEPFDLLGAQRDVIGGRVLLDSGHPLGARDRGDVVALRE